ncbi:hypothetical protein FFLO_03202 [Filobasidium floriforme]|uniref:Probable vacuolar protein sorting-associated protein 16 homolog n=1 Tax=Filobasidium floriforme TaxID=5210 RepID=A0A8K0JLF4_9TREE|nr:hypothetical protein FFLO_03202 [Filobasidium floriforme]
MVNMSSPTDNWDTLENVFYRKEEVYSMAWDVADLSDYHVAAARYGGPIALIRDENKIVLAGRHISGKPKINVFTAAGYPIVTLTWDLPTPVFFDWTPQESLVVLAESGVYRIYDLAGDYKQYSLGSDVDSLGVVSAQIHDGGFVALLGDLNFVQVKGWEGGRPTALASPSLQEAPRSWLLIPPEQAMSGHVEVLVSVRDTVLSIDELDSVDQHLARGPFTSFRMSPNGKFLAFITASLSLWVVSSDFSRNLSDVDISTLEGNHDASSPDDIQWCGDHAVVLSWRDGRVVVVGPGGDGLSYAYTPGSVLIGEIDGLRIVSASSSDFVQKVPGPTLSVFQPGSSSPAAILYDAMEQFDRKSPKADEAVRSIKTDLADAVDTCVEAAGLETDAVWQKKLLKTATFGRAFLDLYNPTDLVNMGQALRVLNAVRFHEVGIPLTYRQYMAAPAERLISRLTARNMHLLALRISSYLQIRSDPVLKHWACAKIAAAQSVGGDSTASQDDDLRRIIVKKFEKEGMAVSYADIAKRAWQVGRTRLATKLLEHERQAAEQVPLLLAMKEDRLALTKAVKSNDPDLVFHVLLNLRGRHTPGDFFSLVDDGTPQLAPAVRLLQVYAKENDRDLLRDLYYQDDRRLDSALLELEEGWAKEDVNERLVNLNAAVKYLSEDKSRSLEAKLSDEAQRLLTQQQTMERDLENRYKLIGLSLNDTMSELLRIGLGKRAEKVRSDWKVSDKRWWWIKLKALVELKDWEGLDAFAKSKKSPIGYEPFVVQLLEKGELTRAANFVARCDVKRRVDLYLQCDDWGRAANECKERGDRGRLEELKRTAPNGLAQREVEEVLRRTNK